MQFYDLKIKQVIRETEDAVSLTFDIPQDLTDTFNFIQGQYLTLQFTINGDTVRRAYSMSSSPLDDVVKITVKQIQNGLVSTHINHNVKEGDTISIMPPNGRFYTTLDAENKKTYYMLGGGSGITPLLSILKTVLETEPLSKVFLFYGNRDEKSVIFKITLDELALKYTDRFRNVQILSHPHTIQQKRFFGLQTKTITSWKGMVGIMDEQRFHYFFNKNRPQHRQQEYFICGPNPMMGAAEKILLEKGVDRKNIHIERFSSNVPANTDGAKKADLSQVKTGATLTAHLSGERISTQIPAGTTILDTLLDMGYDAPYSCKTGACATCLAKCIKGKVQMDECLTLEPEEIEDGLILTCQSRPITDSVEITYDVK